MNVCRLSYSCKVGRFPQKPIVFMRFRSVLQECEENPGKYIIATPIKRDGSKYSNNPSVSFMIASYIAESKSFKIYTFDDSITVKQADINQKINKALFVIEDLLQGQQFGDNKMQINHFALFTHYKKTIKQNKEEIEDRKEGQSGVKQIDYQSIQFEDKNYQVDIADCDLLKMILKNNHSRKIMRNIYFARKVINLVAKDNENNRRQKIRQESSQQKKIN